MMHDVKVATTCCSHLTNALGKVYDNIDDVPEEDIVSLHGSIKKFFGTMPDEDSDWRNNLWTGKFYPILAYCTLYDVNVDWESQLEFVYQEWLMLGLLLQNYQVVYRLAHVYKALGYAVQQHLAELPDNDIVDRHTWMQRKRFTIIAFENMDTVRSICSHVGELISQDRYLRKIQKAMPKQQEPWHSAERYFPIRPSNIGSKLPVEFVLRAIRDYSFDREYEFEADSAKIKSIMGASTKEDKADHFEFRRVSQILGLALTFSSII
jgi:hypothetical protein